MTINTWFRPSGSLAQDGWDVVVGPAIDGWRYSGLRVATLDGEAPPLPAGEVERMVVPLTGDRFVVLVGDERHELTGRASPFDGPADVLVAGSGTPVRITGTGSVAVAEAPTAVRVPTAVLRAGSIPVELRGAGATSRQVHNFGVPGALPADRLIVCEVITPAGNWSSYPAHKHDERRPDESELEEIYWFATASSAGAPAEADAFAFFATTSSDAGSIETTALVRTGDVALVPFGYHGPAAAPPGVDLYYLNVMAGPGEREWRIRDHPAQAWLRETWPNEAVDPRLPYGRRSAS
ncbi:MAG TPA: 5-deoxy-glucuronate isomerase [Amnibacterium sp.]|nr:5-deoxy-glucuronate isomerase [Amnibacterium sp.]